VPPDAALLARLVRAAQEWEARVVIPHCAVCARPCCKLESVVLDLDWPRTRTLYRIGESQRVFDHGLAEGRGPEHIRKQGDTYYAHGKPCPAYDEGAHRCTVYGTPTKPPSCSDFPIYEDGDGVTADQRCEAVDVAALQKHCEEQTGTRLRALPDADFPQLVTLVPAAAPRPRVDSSPHRKPRTGAGRKPAGKRAPRGSARSSDR
jgi:Fe-S-cluster containining protein